jgi:transcriptional regulator with XRE-family HTH domain
MNTPQIIIAIRDRRKELKRSQAWVAEIAGIARETYSRFEQGKHDISLRRLLRICSALGLDLLARPGSGRPTLEDLDQIFGGDDD